MFSLRSKKNSQRKHIFSLRSKKNKLLILILKCMAIFHISARKHILCALTEALQ